MINCIKGYKIEHSHIYIPFLLYFMRKWDKLKLKIRELRIGIKLNLLFTCARKDKSLHIHSF